MQRSHQFANPFYGLLVAAGISFAVTATAYGVMAFRDRDQGVSGDEQDMATNDHPLMIWMRDHGEGTLLGELGLLAVSTIGAIATDEYWQARDRAKRSLDAN